MNRVMVIILAIFIIFMIILFGIGFILPKQRNAKRIAQFSTAPKLIWEIMTDISSQTTWRPELRQVKITGNAAGHEQWIEYPRKGPAIYFQTVFKNPSSGFEFEMTDGKTWKGYWTGELIPLPNHRTRVILNESSEITNPLIRLLSYLFFDLGAIMDQYLHDLAVRLGENYQKL